jgi:hypothetical protein
MSSSVVNAAVDDTMIAKGLEKMGTEEVPVSWGSV